MICNMYLDLPVDICTWSMNIFVDMVNFKQKIVRVICML